MVLRVGRLPPLHCPAQSGSYTAGITIMDCCLIRFRSPLLGVTRRPLFPSFSQCSLFISLKTIKYFCLQVKE